ncbi:MAG: antibiotic biosynthesis monooxygenase [Myxococcaceae bacterium]|nr:antibiotic biosynthesis monooxygenase [Myxococcaceae bacterium]
MIAVLFEVWPHAETRQTYLTIAQTLADSLHEVDGFLSIERFQSLSEPDKLLSLSFWRDEQAVAQWRNLDQHRAAQALGRAQLFRDYRLRIAAVIRDYGMNAREQAPQDSRAKLEQSQLPSRR